MTVPHITIVWDGDTIDKITLPRSSEYKVDTRFVVSVDKIKELVEEFLSSKGYSSPGLSLRIHSRDAVTEYVLILHKELLLIIV